MKIIAKGVASEILVQTVTLHAEDDPLTTWLFLCPYCSANIVQTQGKVTKMQPGLVPTTDVVVISKCGRCGLRYTFRTSKQNRERTEVILTRFENDQDYYRCYICRSPLLRFNYDDIYLMPVLKKVELPISINCLGYHCPALYYVTDIV